MSQAPFKLANPFGVDWHFNSQCCVHLQVREDSISLALHTFIKLGFCPAHLLAALDSAVQRHPEAHLSDASCCVKAAFACAVFGRCDLPLFAAAMGWLKRFEERKLTTWMRYEVAVAHTLALADGCDLLACNCDIVPFSVLCSASKL